MSDQASARERGMRKGTAGKREERRERGARTVGAFSLSRFSLLS
jgi:hypothetical protein